MQPRPVNSSPKPPSQEQRHLLLLLRLPRILAQGDPAQLAPLIRGQIPRADLSIILLMILGIGIYGATMGLWRGPQMALYTAIKLPLVVLLTALGNGLLNGILAALTGSGLSFRETQRAVMISFATLGIIAASLAPLTAFQALELWNSQSTAGNIAANHRAILLTHTILIALSGFVANLTLIRLLETICTTPLAAIQTFISWLLGNLIVGAQIGYVLRPFFGSSNLPVQFIRKKPMEGNFYESVWRALQNTQLFQNFNGNTLILLIATIFAAAFIGFCIRLLKRKISNPTNS